VAWRWPEDQEGNERLVFWGFIWQPKAGLVFTEEEEEEEIYLP